MELHEMEKMLELLEKYIQSTNSVMVLETIIPIRNIVKEHIDLKKNGY